MHGHETPQFLDDPLPTVFRVTWPELGSILAGALVLYVCVQLSAPLHLGAARLLLTALPAALVIVAGFALYRGRIERYPSQIIGYTWRCYRRLVIAILASIILTVRRGVPTRQ